MLLASYLSDEHSLLRGWLSFTLRGELLIQGVLMVIDLERESMLGHWDVNNTTSQCEFQFGQRLIYVQHPKYESPKPYLAAAQQVVGDTWTDISDAVSFAEELSRKLIPDFWEVHDQSQKAGSRFDVYSIHFDLNDRYPVYTIGVNHNFEFEVVAYAEDDLWQENPIRKALPEPPENFWICVRRVGKNCFEHAT
jgi:hypothetical protein